MPASGGIYSTRATANEETASHKSLSDIGNACHTAVKAKDYIFSPV